MEHRGKARPMVMPCAVMLLLSGGGLGGGNVLALSSLNWMPLECKASFAVSLVGRLKSLDNIIDPFTI